MLRARIARSAAPRVAPSLQQWRIMPPVLVKHIMSAPVVALFAEQTLLLAC
jgi:hypothetical protein